MIKWAACLAAVIVLSAFTRDCYSSWLSAFNSATAIYNSDLEYCDGTVIAGPVNSAAMCRLEAGLVYDSAINQAGADYEACVLGN